MLPLITKGAAPAILRISQLRATVTKPSFAWNTLFPVFFIVSKKPMIRQMTIVIKNANPDCS